MMSSNMGSTPDELPRKADMTPGRAGQSPMSQQDAGGLHGHQMHPQKFVRLVGCHDSNAGKPELADR